MNKSRFLLVLMLAGLLSGCTGWFSKVPGLAQVSQLTVPRATEKDFAFIEDATLRKHMVAQANATTFRVRMTSSGLGAIMVQEIQLADATMAMSSWQEDGQKKSNEMVVMGETTYIRDYSDNLWWKQTAVEEMQEEDTQPTQEPIDFKEEYIEMKDTTTYKNLGQEACGSLTCHKYQQLDSQNPEATRTLWFDVKEYLLRKDESGYGEFSSSSEYEYADIQIVAPTPTKEVPQGKSIYEYMMYGDVQLEGVDALQFNKAMEEAKKMQADFDTSIQTDSFESEEVDYSDSFEEGGIEE